MQTVDDSYQPRFSNGSMCLFLPVSQPQRSLSYDKLPPEPLRLTVLKLDGSSFGIKVAKTGTVGELKLAVEAAFDHLPKKGPAKVSWAHVWGQFCLCHDGQKLLIDSDYIRMYGVQDGDQLQFAHHASNCYNLVTVLDKEDCDSDYVRNSYGYEGGQQNGEKDDINDGQNVEDKQVDNVELDNGVPSQCEHKIIHLLRGMFTYQKLCGSAMRIGDGTTFSKISNRGLGRLRKVIRSYNNPSIQMQLWGVDKEVNCDSSGVFGDNAWEIGCISKFLTAFEVKERTFSLVTIETCLVAVLVTGIG